MKALRQLCVALVFTFALTLPALAGEITTMVVPPQPAQAVTRQGEIQIPVVGQIDTGSSEATAADSATEIALNLFQSVLSLF
jgi:hypothetical protein